MEKLLVYKAAGINRISLGLQSTNDDELRLLGRIHTYEDFLDSYEMVRKSGFTNVNIDLMSAIPKQKITTYERSLDELIKLNPEHISSYSLIIEEGTNFYKKYSEIQTNSGNFIYWEIPETHHKIAMFETGFGDGYYMSLWGLNEKDEVCEVVIPFINPELID